MQIPVNLQNLYKLEALASKTRVAILEQLGEGAKNISELAAVLELSSAMITRHIALLEKAGFVKAQNISGKRGLQKLCSLAIQEAVLSFDTQPPALEYHSISIPIGQYQTHAVTPSCGLASREGLIGQNDDPRYFSHPSRVEAALLWFRTGYVEYVIPSYLFTRTPVKVIEISLELCSEFPGYNEHWPSDIHFSLGGRSLGVWTSPGDFGAKRGMYTPSWWSMGSQHGLLKTLRITEEGCMMDGMFLSDIGINQILFESNKDMPFKISIPHDATHAGGMNLFGKGFGNYDQDITIRVY